MPLYINNVAKYAQAWSFYLNIATHIIEFGSIQMGISRLEMQNKLTNITKTGLKSFCPKLSQLIKFHYTYVVIIACIKAFQM